MKIKAIIVEDELLGQLALSSILQKNCNDTIEIVDITANVEDSVKSIKKNKPQLIFLDIVLGSNANGAFDILESFEQIDFHVVFTTSSQFPKDILRALNKYGTKRYLVKPLDVDEVVEAVECVKNAIDSNKMTNEIKDIKKLISNIQNGEIHARLKIPVRNGFQLINCHDIIMLRSNVNSTMLFLTNQETLSSSKSLNYFQSALDSNQFKQAAKSHVVNLKHVTLFTHVDGGTINLTNGCQAPLSDKYKDDFFRALDEYNASGI